MTAGTSSSAARKPHPDMPPLKAGVDCPWLLDWVHYCDRGKRHAGAHHCPCGLSQAREKVPDA